MSLKTFFIFLYLSYVKADYSPFNFDSQPELIKPLRPQDPEGLSFRLPNNTRPIHYDIWLSTAVHEADFNFNGSVHIRFRTLEPSRSITLNFKQIGFHQASLFETNGVLIQSVLRFDLNLVTELATFTFDNELPENQEFLIRIWYFGILRTDSYGFYRGSYVDENGQVKWYGTTQFQATDARHAFPCYDEPQIRAAYTLHMRHHQSYHALGNKPISSIDPPDEFGYVITHFEEIPDMHSYLNAFTVSDFIFIENATVRPPQRVYGRRQRINNGDGSFALDISPKIMATCEEYYGFNFTFPKMDQIALTVFPAGAMENWGQINYQEVFLLFDPLISTTQNKSNIVAIVAHEFMHQWIGNIINPEWWTYLWINEGFATVDEYHIAHFTFPEDRYLDTLYTMYTQPVLVVDADPNIRHMSWYVESPGAILQLFDWISYSKAGSVLLTFQHAYEFSTFRKGVRYLLHDRFHQYHNSDILYANIQRAVNEDHGNGNFPNVADAMRTWEMQAGYPVVTISRTGNTMTITQERFMYDKNLNSENLWWIPLNYVVGSNPNFTSTSTDIWMNPVRSININSNTAPKPWTQNDWIIFNIQARSYIRVNYDDNLWQLIINQLNLANRGFERIYFRNRGQLIDDAHHLARGDRTSFKNVLGLIEYMWQETDHVPWMAANRAFNFITPRITGTKIYEKYQEFIRRTVKTLFNYLGVAWIPYEPRLDRLSRPIAVNLACRHHLNECLNRTNEELTAFAFEGRRIEVENRPAIYCNGLRTGNILLFLSMQNLLLRTVGNQGERNTIIDGMACTENSDILLLYLNLGITPGIPLTSAERLRILRAPATNGENSLKIMMKFIETKYEFIIAEGEDFLSSMLDTISNNIASETLYSRFMLMMAELLCRNAITSGAFTRYLNDARGNLEWQEKYLKDFEDFFNDWNKS